MAQTSIPAGHPLAEKIYGAAVFAQTQKANTFTNRMIGGAPVQSDAEAKLRQQTSRDMPVVRVTDLSEKAGDTVQVDLFHQVGGKPIMGDRMAEGKGEAMTSSSQEIKINLATKVVDAGGKMTNQRTRHRLRNLAKSNLVAYFNKLADQQTLVHLSGARGSENGLDWLIPLTTDPDFSEIVINPLKAPTYNRHFVADGLSIVRGGAQIASMDATDVFKLEHIDALSTMLADEDVRLQPVQIEDDPAKEDEPLYVMYVSNRAWHQININTSNQVWRTFLQNAWNRKSYGSKHPLFSGEAGMWGNILVRKADRIVRHVAGDPIPHITAANRYTATETNVTVPSIGTGAALDRCLVLGGQALAHVYGKNGNSGLIANWKERMYNFERNTEVMGDLMTGCDKLRFKYKVANGLEEPTDHGVLVFDVVSPAVA